MVAIAVDPTTLYVYWEVRPSTMARARARRQAGHLALRVMSVTPSWDGPLTQTRDLRIDPLFGDLFVRDLPPGANVRVSVGWLSAGSAALADGEVRDSRGFELVQASSDFEPFAVGLEINAPRALPAETTARRVGVWSGAAPGSPGGQQLEAAAPGAAPAPSRDVAGRAMRRMAMSAPAPDRTWVPGDRPAERSQPERRSWRLHRGGGASDLYLEQEEEAAVAAWRRRWGGASELGRGGASELPRPGGGSELFGASNLPRR